MTAPSRAARGLLSLADLEPAELDRLVRRSVELHRDPAAHDRPLAGLVGGLLFTRTSTRTRTAFTVGIARLGGTPVAYGPADLQTATGETLEDTGRVLGIVDTDAQRGHRIFSARPSERCVQSGSNDLPQRSGRTRAGYDRRLRAPPLGAGNPWDPSDGHRA